MAKINFTAGRISDFKCPPDKREATLWDATTKGLGLRATTTSKSYIFLSMLKDGRKVRITIGDPSHYGIDDARAEATKLQKSINDNLDPREVKAEKIAASVTKRKQARAKQAPALDAWGKYLLAKADSWSELTCPQ